MISIDDHPPPDPSSSDYQNHHQQKEVSHDLNNGEKPPASVSDIDLLKPTDDDTNNNNNPLPNFSIRDYVFGSRCKDIACNWPFSHENLQLCLQYGVKNLLPPFQSLDQLISNPSDSRCAAENRLPDEEIVCNSDRKLADRIEPQSCHLEKDLAHTKSKKSHPASSQKTLNTTNQTTVKKYKFIMKLNSGVEPVEEEMASKVCPICPVCKTFSSSSNTTLNAHIDRCLSEESSMKWTTNPKIIVKHRIKPRKTRLMVDIYKTAPYCTIEELDRRNGTSWATNSNFPDQELEFQPEEKKLEEATFVPEVTGHEDTVYIDSNGTKVRILSMPKVGSLDDHEARKLQKGGKGSKIMMKKKKKKAFKKFCFLKPHHPVSEVIGGQEDDVAVEERCDKDVGENPMKVRIYKQTDDLVITRPPWACSKRTGLTKKRRSLMQDRYEDPLSIKSKSGNFSSLKDNPSSPSQEHNARSKFNMKRKFSALKKSGVDCFSTENPVMGPSQDSLKQKSQIEEDTSKKLPFEIVNVLETDTKKSITSKSSNGYSSEGLEIAFIDPPLDVESSRSTEIPSHSDVQRSFMGLRNSLDDEFSNMVSRLDNIMNDTEKQGNYFQEVDPIPIPGPPGSFLPPSPGGDMVSEEVQGNSSLTTTSRFQSSEDQYNHDMLDSPISTISSSSLAKSAIRSDDKSSSVKVSNFTEKGPTQNEQPCVCSRKNGSSYHQDSAFEFNRRPDYFFPLISHPKLPPPETAESGVSPSTPVLRLMGKNLTVVKTDDDYHVPSSQQLRPPPFHQQLHNIQNNYDQDSFFYGYPSQHPVIFNHNQNGSKPLNFNVHPPKNMTRVADLRLVMATRGCCHRLDIGTNEDNSHWKSTKEIIVIDDSSENEADDDRMRQERMGRNHPYDGRWGSVGLIPPYPR